MPYCTSILTILRVPREKEKFSEEPEKETPKRQNKSWDYVCFLYSVYS